MSLVESSRRSNVNEYDEGLNSDTIQKYKTSADIVNETMKIVIAKIAVGGKIAECCKLGDDTITSKSSKVYAKQNLEKGIAFPTCISINNCVGHFSPLPDSEETFKEGDLIKIDMGAHVDGYIAIAAQTIVLKAPGNAEPVTGPVANVISAAYYAAEIAGRMVKAGANNSDVTNMIQKVADIFHCKPVEGVLSHQMSRFVLDGEKVIINKPDADHIVDVIRFEQGEVYCIDIVMSTAEGKTREEEKTTVYKKNSNSYSLKLKASRAVYGEIIRRFPTLPFSIRQLEDQKSRLGIVECVKHELLDPYPVLFEKDGGLVAQSKITVLITSNGTQKINTNALPANIKSEYQIEDPVLKEILSGSPSQSVAPASSSSASTDASTSASSSSASTTSATPSSSSAKKNKKKKKAAKSKEAGGEEKEEGEEEEKEEEKGKEKEEAAPAENQ